MKSGPLAELNNSQLAGRFALRTGLNVECTLETRTARTTWATAKDVVSPLHLVAFQPPIPHHALNHRLALRIVLRYKEKRVKRVNSAVDVVISHDACSGRPRVVDKNLPCKSPGADISPDDARHVKDD